MNPHWNAFAEDLFWFVKNRRHIDVGPLSHPGRWQPSRSLAVSFPVLARLLSAAHTSSIAIDGDEFVLFSWEDGDRIPSWLSPLPGAASPGLLPAHSLLLKEFGGIVERGGEFEGQWLLNTNDALTSREAGHDASFIRDYEWAFQPQPGHIPIDVGAYYSICREANGNDTLCHRVSGEVLLFAPEHSFEHVVPFEGCPEFTLYRIKGGATFTEWVETVAGQWAEHCRMAA